MPSLKRYKQCFQSKDLKICREVIQPSNISHLINRQTIYKKNHQKWRGQGFYYQWLKAEGFQYKKTKDTVTAIYGQFIHSGATDRQAYEQTFPNWLKLRLVKRGSCQCMRMHSYLRHHTQPAHAKTILQSILIYINQQNIPNQNIDF